MVLLISSHFNQHCRSRFYPSELNKKSERQGHECLDIPYAFLNGTSNKNILKKTACKKKRAQVVHRKPHWQHKPHLSV